MRSLSLASIVLLVVVAFAGCTGNGGASADDATTTSSSSSSSSKSATTSASKSSTTSSNATTTTAAANRAPTGTLSAAPASGAAPLAVTFNLTGTDADGDNVTWKLSFGDGNATNGTTLPASVVHNYTAAANYTAVLNLTDGKASHAYNATISVAAPSGGGGAPAGPEPLATLTGTVIAPDPLAMIPDGFCTVDLFAGIGTGSTVGNHWAVESAWIGRTYAIEPATLLVTFFDGAGFPSGHGGTVPGATDLIVCGIEPTHVAVDFTVTIT